MSDTNYMKKRAIELEPLDMLWEITQGTNDTKRIAYQKLHIICLELNIGFNLVIEAFKVLLRNPELEIY